MMFNAVRKQLHEMKTIYTVYTRINCAKYIHDTRICVPILPTIA